MSAHILIVDDEPSLVQGLTYALTREGYDVSVAVDGESAVETALATDFDLIILDLMLPGLSGTEACRQIRAARDVPIIMLTALDSERDLVNGLEVGADDYVTKPFSAAELMSRVAAHLRRRKLDRTANTRMTLSAGDIVVDLVADKVTVDGTPVAPDTVRVQDPLPAGRRRRARRCRAARSWSISGAARTSATSTPARCTSRRCGGRSNRTRPSRDGCSPFAARDTSSFRNSRRRAAF